MNYECTSNRILKPENKEIKLIIRDKKKEQGSCAKEIVTCSPCPPRELIKNGSFEIFGAFNTFADWSEEELPGDIRIGDSSIPHEGLGSMSFNSLVTDEIEDKFGLVYQNVTVNPGCFLALSYATNFLRAGVDFRELAFRARVYYNGTAPTDLINIETLYGSDILAGTGFDFHQKTSDVSVPEGVTNVTVEFQIRITDRSSGTGTQQTVFLLDSVSLRSV
ncbi:MAG: hypothetical protein ACOX77_09865 [Caldicoprobacterales bacterium]